MRIQLFSVRGFVDNYLIACLHTYFVKLLQQQKHRNSRRLLLFTREHVEPMRTAS